MARAGLGGDAGSDDVDPVDKHYRPHFYAQTVLRSGIWNLKLSKNGTEISRMPPQTLTTRITVAERAAKTPSATPGGTAKIALRNLNFYYGKTQALHEVSLEIPDRIVMAFIGPSGCGKSTLLRTLNRMNDVIPSTRVEGEVLMDGRDIYEAGTDVVELRRKVGMVFQKSNPFPKSIFDNVAYGLRINRLTT